MLADSPIPLLVNTDPTEQPDLIIARCLAFADSLPPATPALIVTILPTPPAGLGHLDAHQQTAALWAFTRQAALAWAPRDIRVNGIELGAGQGTAGLPPIAATPHDITRTLRAMLEFSSMTGQIIRLGS